MYKEKFHDYTVEQLDKSIVDFYEIGKKYSETEAELLEEMLHERQQKINETFEWTPENKEKFLCLNRKLIDCWEKLHAEALQVVETLQSRLNKPDRFLHDYEVEAKIRPFINKLDEDGEWGEAYNCIEEVLINLLDDFYPFVNRTNYNSRSDNTYVIYLKKEQNWSHWHQFKGEFEGEYISQAMHDLYDHTYLSFPDILKINELWGELQIIHQHFVEL